MSTVEQATELTEQSDPEAVRRQAEILAEKMALRHYNDCYGSDPPCRNCICDTPLAGDRPEWCEQTNALESLVSEAQRRADELADGSTDVAGWVRGAYHEAFLDAAVPPDACPECKIG